MKKLLDSDWLRAVQFKCNNSAKSVTPVQITHRNSGLWLTERRKEIFKDNDITYYHMQGKITECWLAETEGIFP